MSYITTRKRQLDRAFKDYKNNQRGKAKAKKRLDICQAKYSEITNRTTVSASNVVVAGMLYFDERKREELLAEAEQLMLKEIMFTHTSMRQIPIFFKKTPLI